jgi:3-oxoacyl-(acyl-carrier-protein) synthase
MIQMERRVVVTGIGVVASNGIGKGAFKHAIEQGKMGIKTLPVADEVSPFKVGGYIDDFVPEHYLERKLVQRTDRMTHLALAAAQEAVYDANLSMAQEDPTRVGAVIANTLGGATFATKQVRQLHLHGPRAMSAFTAVAWIQVANVGQAALRYGFQGYCKVPVNDLAGGLDGLGTAYRAIRRGAADILIAGGCEAPLDTFVLFSQGLSGWLVATDDPTAYRPFDRHARGFLPAEGAGLCILEDYEHARKRGANIYGEIIGYGQSNDATGWRKLPENGRQYARAIQQVMHEGKISLDEIGYFSLDGRALPIADRAEVDALQHTFGTQAEHIPVSVPRTMQGHSYAAAGAIDTIGALLALQDGFIPPTLHCTYPIYNLNLVRNEARSLHGNVVILGARSYGGSNVVLAIRKIT